MGGSGKKEEGLTSAARRLLQLYRTRYPDTEWWEIPPDGFIHDNLFRLLTAANHQAEAHRIARDPKWWTLRLNQGLDAIWADTSVLNLKLEWPMKPDQTPAQYVIEHIQSTTDIPGALRRAAEQSLSASTRRPKIIVVGDLGDFPVDILRGEFEVAQLPSLKDYHDAIVSKPPLNASDLRQMMSNNTPVFCLDMLNLGYPVNRIPDVLLSNLKSTLLPRAVAPPTWVKHAESLNELLQSRDTITRARYTEIYDRYPHFRQWAFYAGTDAQASPVERAALYTFFLARLRPEFSSDVIDIALKEPRQDAPLYLLWLALEVVARILGLSACRSYIMNRPEILLPRVSLSAHQEQFEHVRALVSIFNLAQQYNLIRESLPSGSQRTGRMEEISATMAISKFDLSPGLFEDTLKSKDGGYRLWAYVRSALHGRRGDIEPILLALQRENQNFCMYYGLRSLDRLTADLKTFPTALFKDLQDLGERIPNSGDRRMVYDRILRRLAQPVAKRAAKKRSPPKRKK